MFTAAYQEKLDAQLKEWDAKLNLFTAKANSLKADAKIEFDQQLETFRTKRQAAVSRLEDLRIRGGSALEDLKEGTEKAWSELAKAMDNIAAHFH